MFFLRLANFSKYPLINLTAQKQDVGDLNGFFYQCLHVVLPVYDLYKILGCLMILIKVLWL